MADSASEIEMESDTSSIDGSQQTDTSKQSPDILVRRIESLSQENRVLRMEVDTLKLKNKALQAENKELRQASVNIQARAEQEEEYISNTLLKKIQSLKREKEMLAVNYEHEEEYLTNDLSRKLNQLRNEKFELEKTLEQEQEAQVNKLLKRIDKLESDTKSKQASLEQLRREKVELENSLEQEQEALVNRLWKRMDKLEAEKRMLQGKLDHPISAPTSPRTGERDVSRLTQNVMGLRQEVAKYRRMLNTTKHENDEKMAALMNEEKHIKEENLRLQRKLQMEIERREALCRHLSESESSLEMDDERHFNEFAKSHDPSGSGGARNRTVSSPVPLYPHGAVAIPTPKPVSPNPTAPTVSPHNPIRCNSCGHIYHHSHTGAPGAQSGMSTSVPSMSPPSHSMSMPGMSSPGHPHAATHPQSSSNVPFGHSMSQPGQPQRLTDKFAKPPIPASKS